MSFSETTPKTATKEISVKSSKINYKKVLALYAIFFFIEIILWNIQEFFCYRISIDNYYIHQAISLTTMANITSFAGLGLAVVARTQTKSVKGWSFAFGLIGLLIRGLCVIGLMTAADLSSDRLSDFYSVLAAIIAIIIILEFILLLIRQLIKDTEKTLIS